MTSFTVRKGAKKLTTAERIKEAEDRLSDFRIEEADLLTLGSGGLERLRQVRRSIREGMKLIARLQRISRPIEFHEESLR